MRPGWKNKTFKEIAKIKGGKRVPKGYKFETAPTAYPYVTVACFTETGTVNVLKVNYINEDVFQQISNYTITPDDMYLSIAGTIGKTGFIPESMGSASLTENACKLIFNDGVDKNYIYYFTRSASFHRQAGLYTRIAAQPKLSLTRLKNISLPIPPLPEQQRIVSILDEVFEGIDKAIANTERNLVNSRELFESYLDGVFKQGLNCWRQAVLNDLCHNITVGHVGSMASKYVQSGIPFLRSQNIKPFEVSLDDVKYIDDEFHRSLKKSSLQPGNVAIVRTGYPGTAAVIPSSLIDANCSDLVIVKPKTCLNPHYLSLLLNSIYGKRLVSSRLVGAAQKHFNVTEAKKVIVPFPSESKQTEIIGNAQSVLAKVKQIEIIYQRKLKILSELKQSILKKTFTGELTAKYADKQMESAV